MDFKHYLSQMGSLYREGAISNFHPGLLKKIGGSLALAGHDSYEVHFEEDAFLWFDIERNPSEMWETANRKWSRHYAAIEALIRQGQSPSRAVYQYLRRYDTYPHAPEQLSRLIHPVMDETGRSYSAWMAPTIQFRRRFERGASIMTNTFGALATMVALAVTADDWLRATPAEWDRALKFGEVGVLFGEMAGAHVDAKQNWLKAHQEATLPTR